MADSEPPDTERLPHVVHTESVNVMGFNLTVVVLSDGRRVYELNEELHRLWDHLGKGPADG